MRSGIYQTSGRGMNKRKISEAKRRAGYPARLAAAVAVFIMGTGYAMAGSLGGYNVVTSYCPQQYLQYWDTIVFTLAVDGLQNSRGRRSLRSGREYDVKIPRDTDSVGDLRELVAYRLSTLGFAAGDGPVLPEHIGQLVHVNSAVFCAYPGDPRVRGSR